MAAGKVTATVTAALGPGRTVTSLVINNVTNVNFDFDRGVVSVVADEAPFQQDFEYSNLATVTIDPAAKTVALST